MGRTSSSKYWTQDIVRARTNKREVDKLKKINEKLDEEIALLKERDVLRKKIELKRREKYYRSKVGVIARGTKYILTGKRTKKISKAVKKAYKDLTNLDWSD